MTDSNAQRIKTIIKEEKRKGELKIKGEVEGLSLFLSQPFITKLNQLLPHQNVSEREREVAKEEREGFVRDSTKRQECVENRNQMLFPEI